MNFDRETTFLALAPVPPAVPSPSPPPSPPSPSCDRLYSCGRPLSVPLSAHGRTERSALVPVNTTVVISRHRPPSSLLLLLFSVSVRLSSVSVRLSSVSPPSLLSLCPSFLRLCPSLSVSSSVLVHLCLSLSVPVHLRLSPCRTPPGASETGSDIPATARSVATPRSLRWAW